MTSLNRTVRCSNCSTDANLSLSSDMDLKELTFAGRCSRCGATLQINFNIIGGSQTNNALQTSISSQSSESSIFSSPSAQQSSEQSGGVNLDESIFGSASSASEASSVSSDSSSSSSDSSDSSSEPSSPFLDSDSSDSSSEEIENVSDALKDLMEA